MHTNAHKSSSWASKYMRPHLSPWQAQIMSDIYVHATYLIMSLDKISFPHFESQPYTREDVLLLTYQSHNPKSSSFPSLHRWLSKLYKRILLYNSAMYNVQFCLGNKTVYACIVKVRVSRPLPFITNYTHINTSVYDVTTFQIRNPFC